MSLGLLSVAMRLGDDDLAAQWTSSSAISDSANFKKPSAPSLATVGATAADPSSRSTYRQRCLSLSSSPHWASANNRRWWLVVALARCIQSAAETAAGSGEGLCGSFASRQARCSGVKSHVRLTTYPRCGRTSSLSHLAIPDVAEACCFGGCFSKLGGVERGYLTNSCLPYSSSARIVIARHVSYRPASNRTRASDASRFAFKRIVSTDRSSEDAQPFRIFDSLRLVKAHDCKPLALAVPSRVTRGLVRGTSPQTQRHHRTAYNAIAARPTISIAQCRVLTAALRAGDAGVTTA